MGSKPRKSSDSNLSAWWVSEKPCPRLFLQQVFVEHHASLGSWECRQHSGAGMACKLSVAAPRMDILQARSPSQEADNWIPATWLFNCPLIHSTI